MKQIIVNNKKKILLSIAVLLIGFILFMPKTSVTQSYVTEKATKGSLNISVSASGNIEPITTYNLSPRTSAKVILVNIEIGKKVKAGDILIQVDDIELQNAVKIAQYNYNAAIYRRDQLKAAPIVDDYAVKQAQQQINTTYIQLQSAKNNLENAKITAPIDGEILAVNVKLGEYTSPTLPAIILANTNTYRATFNINEIDIAKIKLGQKVTLTMDALSENRNGTVSSIGNLSTNITGIVTYQVLVDITEQANLRSGMSVDAEIAVSEIQNAIIVPSAAIKEKDGQTYVTVVTKDSEGKQILNEVKVEAGLTNYTLTEILSGVNEGDEVLINIVNQNTNSGFGIFSKN